MTQPQLSVRDKIWNMFCKEFWIITGNSTPELERNRRKFIDQIITLAQEEKIKAIEQLTHNETGLMPEMGIFDSGYELAKEDVIKILKQ